MVPDVTEEAFTAAGMDGSGDLPQEKRAAIAGRTTNEEQPMLKILLSMASAVALFALAACDSGGTAPEGDAATDQMTTTPEEPAEPTQ